LSGDISPSDGWEDRVAQAIAKQPGISGPNSGSATSGALDPSSVVAGSGGDPALSPALSAAVDALGKVMLEMQRRRLIARLDAGETAEATKETTKDAVPEPPPILAEIGMVPIAGIALQLGERQAISKRMSDGPLFHDERQLLSLIGEATLALGDPLLDSTSEDDLDDRLDRLHDSAQVAHFSRLLLQHVTGITRNPTWIAGSAWDEWMGRMGSMSRDGHAVMTWLSAQHQVIREYARRSDPKGDAVRSPQAVIDPSIYRQKWRRRSSSGCGRPCAAWRSSRRDPGTPGTPSSPKASGAGVRMPRGRGCARR
jgi:hypothetical protein